MIMDEFMLRALIGGLALAAALGPLGAFVLWRRMAYAGDAIAHAALLGVALSLITQGVLPMTAAIFLVAAGVAIFLAKRSGDGRHDVSTMLGLIAHGALALGLVLVAMNHEVRVDINAYLFGDILAIDWNDVAILGVLSAVLLLLTRIFWRPLLLTTIDPAVAEVEGINPTRIQLIFTLMLAALIAVAIKLAGVLLITALLIMPAAASRNFSRTPVAMALGASAVGMVAVAGGLFASLKLDAPSGPMMVVVAAGLFMVSLLLEKK